MTTICLHCRHVDFNGNDPDDEQDYDGADVWVCRHPAVQREETINPVNGKKAWLMQDENGKPFRISYPTVYCSDVNDGNCPHYEAREPLP